METILSFRALTFSALQSFLMDRNSDLQVIYSDDFTDENQVNVLSLSYQQIKFTKVAAGFNAASILN
jgi:hypothetical protein